MAILMVISTTITMREKTTQVVLLRKSLLILKQGDLLRNERIRLPKIVVEVLVHISTLQVQRVRIKEAPNSYITHI